ncbi:hypothetical protein [Cryptosporangium arvum]|uniref:hypothetical protein n=1 Tax=Cryptosporangium arvum TaxID=80871 RepID=UPI0004BB7554|nr:hypothetical protein [Cryptosporangium arvum]
MATWEVELVVETGLNPKTGKRRQARRRFATIDDAVDAYAKIHTEATAGTFVARSSLTVDQVCQEWLDGRHGLRPKTLAGIATSSSRFEASTALCRSGSSRSSTS